MRSALLDELKSIIYKLHFNVSLSLLPIFLWAYALTEADVTAKFLYGALILHFLIYPAINGFYAYFDKAKGNVYGIRRVNRASYLTLIVSSIFLILGLFLSFKVNSTYFYVILSLSVLFLLYSYPGTGIRPRAFYAILFVSLSYGLFGFLAGWACAFSNLNGLWDLFNISAVIASMGFIAGFYTLSLVYKVSEDSDKTGELFIEKLGPFKTFKMVKIILPVSALIAMAVIAGKFSFYELSGIIIYLLIGFLVIDRFEKNFYLQKETQNYRMISSIILTNSFVLSLYLLFRILAINYLFID